MEILKQGGCMGNWRTYSLLLCGIGVSYLGNWIYLVALNIFILDMTGSAAAVAGIYIVGPVARLLTQFWAGSLIDRVNRRKLMIYSDVARGALVLLIPLLSSVWVVYAILFIANVAGSFFGPSSTYYVTKLVTPEERRRFNSIMSMLNAGAFLIGPAIAGVLIATTGTSLCIFINGITFFFCAALIALLPDVSDEALQRRQPLSWNMIVNDWRIVQAFVLHDRYFLRIYLLFQMAMMIAFALDSQEVTFLKQQLSLTDKLYGVIVSIAGVGSIAGAITATATTKKFSLQAYLAVGMLLTTIGYTMFYGSFSFLTAAISFLILGFFMSFANAGCQTFYQNNVPADMMGRFGSLAGMFQSIVRIVCTFLLGIASETFDLQSVSLLFSYISVVLSVVLLLNVFKKSKQAYYAESKTEERHLQEGC